MKTLNLTFNDTKAVTSFMMVSLMVVAGFMIPATTWADVGTLGDMAGNVDGQVSAIAGLIKSVAILIGIGFVVAACVMFANMKKPGNNTGIGTPLLMLVVGILLISITAFMSMGTGTLFGAGASSDVGTILN